MGLVQAVGEAGPIRVRSERWMPRTSWEAAETLATASSIGTSAGRAFRAFSVGTCSAGTTTIASTPSGGSSLVAVTISPVAADDEAAVQRRRDVVGVALDLGRVGEHVGRLQRQLIEMVGGEQPGDDRRGAGAEARGERDLAADPKADVAGGAQVLEGAHAEVVAVKGDVEVLGLDREGAGLLHLELEVHGEGRREHVVARPQVGRGGGTRTRRRRG